MYVDLAGLARYKQDFGAWARGALLPKDAAAARVRTAKAGAVSFVPVQETPLDVSVDFLFTETPPASGDKSPENPSTITGVSSVKVGRVGKNLLLRPDRPLSYTGYTLSFNADCSYSVNGSGSLFFSVTDGDAAVSGTPSTVVLDENKTYTLSVKLQSGSVGSQAYLTIGIPSGNAVVIGMPQTAGTTAKQSFSGNIIPDGRFHCRINATENGSFSNAVFFVQLEEGSSETAFEEPMSISDANYTLLLGSTYYGGTLDVASGVMTATHTKATVTGSTTYSSTLGLVEKQDAYMLSFYPPSTRKQNQNPSEIGCDLLPVYFNSGNENRLVCSTNSNNIGICLLKSLLGLSDNLTFNDVKTAFSSFFTAHPMSIVYQLATPQTVQLTPTEILSLTQSSDYDPRVNTVYSDAQAVQVGYLKHPSAASADLRNAAVSLGGGV